MKTLSTIFLINSFIFAQEPSMVDLIFEKHDLFKENSILKRRIKHEDVVRLIQKIDEKKVFRVKKIGTSVESRDIFMLSIGEGKTRVLLWSQMHGDEPTATMALFDLFNFFQADDEFNSLRRKILSELELCFIPMLNPDGAEKYKRRNTQDIDINRDAAALQTPEGRILKNAVDSLKPAFGFNLHDQSIYSTVGKSEKSATISFLAPAYNYEKSVNEVRLNAIKLISGLYGVLNSYIPGHIAKYDDEFEPRAFGDNIQKWGVSTLLVESGGYINDVEKQYIRKLNFLIFLASFDFIADKAYLNFDPKVYDSIPFNQKCLVDLVLKNVVMDFNGKDSIVDIGIIRNEINYSRDSFYYHSEIDEIGDLSLNYFGYETVDCKGMQIALGKVFYGAATLEEYDRLDFKKLLGEGYVCASIENIDKEAEFVKKPMSVIAKKTSDMTMQIKANPNFLIMKNGNIAFAVINGFVVKTDSLELFNQNAAIIK